MKINGLQLPTELVKRLDLGIAQLCQTARENLRGMIRSNLSGGFIPDFYDYDGIVGANRLWRTSNAKFYLGAASKVHTPGMVNPRKTLIFGHIEPDSPIALDYRTLEPTVIYFGDVESNCYWLEISSNYNHFINSVFFGP